MTNKLSKIRFKDYYINTIQLDNLTKFNLINIHKQTNIKKIILNFSFNSINFNKKKAIPFFMALELITNQKNKINKSKKPTMVLKIRKGSMVGCSVTLQNENLYNFYEYLLLALSRSENFQGFSIKNFNNLPGNTFSFVMDDLFNFYQVEADLNNAIKMLDITFLFNTNSREEKIFLISSYKIPILEK